MPGLLGESKSPSKKGLLDSPDVARAARILMDNADKNFVQRVLLPSAFPALTTNDGRTATHEMAWTESDGKYFVHPTIFMDGNQLNRYEKDPFGRALQTGDFVQMPTAKEAEWFSKNYKLLWGN